jgi:hypothetical protein
VHVSTAVCCQTPLSSTVCFLSNDHIMEVSSSELHSRKAQYYASCSVSPCYSQLLFLPCPVRTPPIQKSALLCCLCFYPRYIFKDSKWTRWHACTHVHVFSNFTLASPITSPLSPFFLLLTCFNVLTADHNIGKFQVLLLIWRTGAQTKQASCTPTPPGTPTLNPLNLPPPPHKCDCCIIALSQGS